MKTKLTHRRLLGILAIGLGCMLVILSMATLVAADPGTPTVDGRFYGDGDEANYEVLGSAAGNRGTLYYTQTGDTLYLAVVVSYTVNDNVFGKIFGDDDDAYVQSAGWSGVGNQHEAKHLINSDHVSLTLKCGGNSWEWNHGYLYDSDGNEDPGEADWLSGHGDSDPLPAGSPPPGLISQASSLQWNLNNAATYSTWDVTLGQASRNIARYWKSPDDQEWPLFDNDVTNNGYSAAVTPPWYDSVHQWEWAMVYELSIDISACPDTWSVDVLGAHNSPSKDLDPNVVIELGNIGDYVWVDDGPTAGLQEPTGVPSDTGGINGVEMELWVDVDADGTFSETADSLVKTMTTTDNPVTGEGGWYLFTNLSPGTYFVRIAPQEFDSGGTLFNYGPTVPNKEGIGDALDSDGDNPTCPYSPTIKTGECGQIGFENNILAKTTLTRDADGHVADNLTIDFGVVPQGPPTAITLSSFAARPSIDDSRRWLWLGLAGVTVVVAGSLFRAKRRHS